MKLKPKKILFLSLIVIIVLISLIAFIVGSVKKQKNNSSFNQAQKQSSQPITATIPVATPSQNSENKYQITRQDKSSYNILQENTELVNSIKKLLPAFKIADMGTSIPVSTAKLDDDKEMLLLWGCTPHNCGGSTIVVAYDQEDNIAYILKENNSIPEGYEIFDSPSQEIQDLLIYYYKSN